MTALQYARGRDWYLESRKPHGGFCFVHANSLMAVWRALIDQQIRLQDLRTWLACHEMRARRCQLQTGRTPRYGYDELARLTNTPAVEHARASIRRLVKCGLVGFEESMIEVTPLGGEHDRGRPVPVPRPVLRMLCRERGRAFVATTLGHLLRCLYYQNGVCRSGGWCKASWVSETFHVAVRAVKEARKRLVRLGLCRLLDADQLRLNRFGRPLVWLLDKGRRSAPHAAESPTQSAPPRQHKQLSYQRVDHQKPARPAGPTGARKQAHGVDIRNVIAEDLTHPRRIAGLFKQARLKGWVHRAEADIINVFAMAAHALRVGKKNPAGLFVSNVASRNWHFLSQRDEDDGRALLRKLRA